MLMIQCVDVLYIFKLIQVKTITKNKEKYFFNKKKTRNTYVGEKANTICGKK